MDGREREDEVRVGGTFKALRGELFMLVKSTSSPPQAPYSSSTWITESVEKAAGERGAKASTAPLPQSAEEGRQGPSSLNPTPCAAVAGNATPPPLFSTSTPFSQTLEAQFISSSQHNPFTFTGGSTKVCGPLSSFPPSEFSPFQQYHASPLPALSLHVSAYSHSGRRGTRWGNEAMAYPDLTSTGEEESTVTSARSTVGSEGPLLLHSASM